ncbi:MAG: hydrogenase maturation nickel metallochaperone HypA [Gammaproteobacteria bacterium]|jgi:hydrogenase nickel incorporation protein HypA/HybF
MHELSVCQSMLRQVTAIADEHQAYAVERVIVRLGPLSGVEPHLLQQAFPLASAGTVASDAELVIERLPVRVRCDTCAAETDALPNRLVCGACGDFHTRLLSGDELVLASVELLQSEPTIN